MLFRSCFRRFTAGAGGVWPPCRYRLNGDSGPPLSEAKQHRNRRLVKARV